MPTNMKKKKEKLKFACPFCYSYHELDALLIKCAQTRCDNYGTNEKYGFFHPDNPQRCVKCKRLNKEIHCPNPHYGFSSGTEGLISSEMFDASNIAIAIIGDEDSGKTCYMSSLLYSLKYTFPRFFSGDLANADERSARFYGECYHNPVYNEKRLPSEKRGIKGDAIPICFYVRVKDPKSSKVRGVATLNYSSTNSELILKSAEEKKTLLPEVVHFSEDQVKNADAIFLVVDPLTIPYVRKKVLERAAELGELESVLRCCPEKERNANDLLKLISEKIDPNISAGKKRINKYLAVVFTKLDILERYYTPLSGSNTLVRESRHLETRSYNLPEHKHTSESVIDLIVKYMGDETVDNLRRFKNYGFFAVSGLGKIPDADGNIREGVAARRVLDPLLWVLAENDLIEKTW